MSSSWSVECNVVATALSVNDSLPFFMEEQQFLYSIPIIDADEKISVLDRADLGHVLR